MYRVHCTNILLFDESRISTKRRIVKILLLRNVPKFINFFNEPESGDPSWGYLFRLLGGGEKWGGGEGKRGPKAWGPRLGGGGQEGGIRTELHGRWCVWGGKSSVHSPFFSGFMQDSRVRGDSGGLRYSVFRGDKASTFSVEYEGSVLL